MAESTSLETKKKQYYGISSFVVSNTYGRRVKCDPPAVTAWSIDAIRLVRDYLFKAGGGSQIPLEMNWPHPDVHYRRKPSITGTNACSTEDVGSSSSPTPKPIAGMMPRWASFLRESFNDGQDLNSEPTDVVIDNLPLMANEIKELLNIMEHQMKIQRKRRLETFKPASRLSRNWYITILATPVSGYALYLLMKEKLWITLSVTAYKKLREFFHEHLFEPFQYIWTELFTSLGRKKIHDHEALQNTIDSLRGMLEHWLRDTYPSMSEKERADRVNRMDLALIEKEFEKQVPSALTNFPYLLRVSLIEMQFIKKELMLAMDALDDLLDSNEFNFRAMATVPAWALFVAGRWGLRSLYYFLCYNRTSREDTKRIIRANVLDIERLLVMRDTPPSAPPPLKHGVISWRSTSFGALAGDILQPKGGPSEHSLNSDDLGMVTLLVHNCRKTLQKNNWRNRIISRTDMLNLLEDCAELTGERGPVSIKQQLMIIERIRRSDFLIM
mmetsp:Transcript_29311/g.67299  ORF Transcript_29311/g.67299 Transcript_29311/m.67299 type:complete len:499 (-) Transcript_29311:282-1778(-)